MAAYNEGPRIGEVLRVASTHPLIDEIIVVNDCSKDNTAEVISQFKNVRLLTNEKNLGKNMAVYRAIKEAKGEFLFFLDADLVGLTADNITKLIEPVLNGVSDLSISLRRNAPNHFKKLGLDYLSGERVMKKSLIAGRIEDIPKLPRFGIETMMNWIIIENKCRVRVVSWPNVDSPFKFHKTTFWRGLWGEVKMNWNILRMLTPFGVIYQIVKIRGLRV